MYRTVMKNFGSRTYWCMIKIALRLLLHYSHMQRSHRGKVVQDQDDSESFMSDLPGECQNACQTRLPSTAARARALAVKCTHVYNKFPRWWHSWICTTSNNNSKFIFEKLLGRPDNCKTWATIKMYDIELLEPFSMIRDECACISLLRLQVTLIISQDWADIWKYSALLWLWVLWVCQLQP